MTTRRSAITEPQNPLPEGKWELFAQKFALSNSLSQSYLDAGYNVQPHNAARSAAQLYSRPSIRARVAYLRSERVMTRLEIAELYSLVARDPQASLKERIHAATELSRLFGYAKVENDEPKNASVSGSEEHNRRLAVAAQMQAKSGSRGS